MSDAGRKPEVTSQTACGCAETLDLPRPLKKGFLLRARDVQSYRVCEGLTELLIYLMVIFGPWAFGTTQPWSIWTMNVAGYLLGILLLAKLSIRWLKGYRPPRWQNELYEASSHSRHFKFLTSSQLIAALRILTFVILGYCLISALNARAVFRPSLLSFEYFDCITWLPHSFDSGKSWFALWTYLGLACSFWAIRDWLLGKSSGEEMAQRQKSGSGGSGASPLFPARLRRLLWVLAINGAVLGLEGVVQRLENSPKLLFLVKPQIHQTADTQFGPYAYRANGAQYFNLLWPVCVGFWWTLNRTARRGHTAHHLLLFCGAIMAACPIVSTSRGGALVTVGIALLAGIFLLAAHFLLAARRQEDGKTRRKTLSILVLFFIVSLSVGFALGWKALRPRMALMKEGFEGREEICEIARQIAADYPVFGTGPGTYESVSELYRPATDMFWPAQAHNDWLETRITFGWVGSVFIYLALAVVAFRWFVRGGIHGGRRFMVLLWLALAGCLAHARFDFPFQVHSILFAFLVLCAVLSTLSRRPFRE